MRPLFLICITLPAFAQAWTPARMLQDLLGPFAPQWLSVVGGRGPSCTTPTGTTLTESFGDSVSMCWSGGSSSCNNLWAVSAGSPSITDSGTFLDNTVCAKSLSFGSAVAMNTVGTFPLILSTDPLDLYIWLKPTTAGTPSYADWYQMTNSSGTYRAEFKLSYTNPNLEAYCYGSNNTTHRNLRVNDWNLLHFHAEPGTSASHCYITTYNGTAVANSYDDTFTQNNVDVIQTRHLAVSNGPTALIGAVRWDSTAGNGSGDSFLIDAETGVNNDALSTTNLAAMTRKGNGSWSGSGTGYSISTDYNLGLTTAVNVAGTSYDGTGTRSLKYDWASAQNDAWSYVAYHNATQATYCYTWRTTLLIDLATFGSFNSITNSLGTDFASLMFNDGKVYLETLTNPNGNPDVGSKYSYSTNTVYKSCLQFNVGGPHKLWLWDSSCGTLLSYQEKAAVNGATALPTTFKIGHSDAVGAVTGATYFDNLVGNYKGGMTTPICH